MPQFIVENSDLIIRLFIALFLGMLIGAERLFANKYTPAGMKTHSMVSTGSALFVIISELIAWRYAATQGFDPTRIASQIVVGVGFLGAGLIMLQGSQLRGLTTAGGLWVTAAVGMAAGFGFYSLAIISTVMILFIFVAVNFLEGPIRKISGDLDNEQQ